MLDVGDCELGRVALGTVLALVRPDLDELAMPLSPARAAAGVEPDAGEVGVALTRFRSLRRLNVAGRMLSALEMAAVRALPLQSLTTSEESWISENACVAARSLVGLDSLSTVRFASCYDVGIVGLLPAALVSLELIVPIDADRMEGLCTLLRQVAELPALEAMILGDSLKNGLFQPGKLFFGQIGNLLEKERRGTHDTRPLRHLELRLRLPDGYAKMLFEIAFAGAARSGPLSLEVLVLVADGCVFQDQAYAALKALPAGAVPHLRWLEIRSRGFKMEWLQGIIEAMPKLSRFLCIDPAVTTKAKDRLIRAKKELDRRGIRYDIDTNLGTGRFEASARQGLRVLAGDHSVRVRLVETGSRR
ncbi:hypothetical protein DFJ74DRAFT_663683 [Hyaloraphidium curvatum]|nr:hypothetical protein DFJ74DRAFT_663683 [Hyaloraphidium curvatum]